MLGHGQLTVPLVRGDSQGRRESYEQRAPVFTIGGSLRQWLDIDGIHSIKIKSYSPFKVARRDQHDRLWKCIEEV